MARTKRLIVCLNATEQNLIKRLAEVEHLSLSALARRLLLQEARRQSQSLFVVSPLVDQPVMEVTNAK